MRKRYVVSIDDIRFVSIECPQCKAKVTLDMKERSPFAQKHGMFAPKECPGCRTPYDSSIQPHVDTLQRAYQSLLAIASQITFSGDEIEA